MKTKIALLFTLALVVSAGWTEGAKEVAADMAESAYHFLRSLDSESQDQANLAFDDENRYDWHFIPRAREGIPYKSMTAAQSRLAHRLMNTALSQEGMSKALGVMYLDQILFEIEGSSMRDSEMYYVTVFGDPAADDEVERVSSRVAAVVAYYPPVDLRNRPAPSERFPATLPESSLFFARGVVVPGAADRFVALAFEEDLSVSVSPILHISADDPPTLLVHGNADALVDFNNSELMHAALSEGDVETELVVIEGAGHGFRTPEDRAQASDALVAWFKEHLRID